MIKNMNQLQTARDNLSEYSKKGLHTKTNEEVVDYTQKTLVELDTFLEKHLSGKVDDYKILTELMEIIYSEKPIMNDINVALGTSEEYFNTSLELDQIRREYITDFIFCKVYDLYLENEPDGKEKLDDFLNTLKLNPEDNIEIAQSWTKSVIKFLCRRDKNNEIHLGENNQEILDKLESDTVMRSIKFIMHLESFRNVKKSLVDTVKADGDDIGTADNAIISEVQERFPELGYIETRLILPNVRTYLEVESNPKVKNFFLNGRKENVSKNDALVITNSLKDKNIDASGNEKFFKRMTDDEIKRIRNKSTKTFNNIYRTIEKEEIKGKVMRDFNIDDEEVLMEHTDALINYIKTLHNEEDYKKVDGQEK